MSLLTRDQILEAQDIGSEDVPVPEWGGTVRVRGLTGTERDAFEASVVQVGRDGSRKMSLANIRARFVALSAVDEEGQLLFSAADVQELGRKSAVALERVWDAARKLSGMSEEDVEELAEGLGDGPSDGSTSDSPPSSD